MSLTNIEILSISLGVVLALVLGVMLMWYTASNNMVAFVKNNPSEIVNSFTGLPLQQKKNVLDGIHYSLSKTPIEYKQLESMMEDEYYNNPQEPDNYVIEPPYISSEEERNYIRNDLSSRSHDFIRDDLVQRDSNFNNTEINRIKMNRMMSTNLR